MEACRLGKRFALPFLLLLVAGTFLACGGGGGGSSPSAIPFTAQMLDDQVFYREDTSSSEMEIITFASGGTFTDFLEDGSGATESPGIWSINGTGQLVLQFGPDNVVVTLFSDTADFLDVRANDGTTTTNVRLFKVTPFSVSAIPGRYVIEDKELTGNVMFSGLGIFVSGGTGTATDGLSDSPFTWGVNADGSMTIQLSGEDDTFYQLAGTNPPGTLRTVGIADVGGSFDHIINMTLTQTTAASGFTNAMVADNVIYIEDTVNEERAVIALAAGNTFALWGEDSTPFIIEDTGTWSISGSESLILSPSGGTPSGIMLVEETTVYFDVLANDGSTIEEFRVFRTIPFTAPGVSIPGTYTSRFKNLDGTLDPAETITFAPGGTGTLTGTPGFTWSINPDGSMSLQINGDTDINTLYLLADSTLPNRPNVIGRTMDAGGNLVETLYLSLTRQ
jgi:hypothetical protein